jgi:tight adherence protein C
MGVLTLAVLIGALTFVGLMSTLAGVFGARIRLAERLGRSSSRGASLDVDGWMQKGTDAVRSLGSIVRRSEEETTRQERKLTHAGMRSKDAVVLFRGAQVGVCLLLLTVFLAGGGLAANPALVVLLSLLGGAALPDIWLARRIARRQAAIRHALPDAMDLAVIAIEAGLGLDQVILRIGQEFRSVHPVLSEEFRLHNLERNLGRTRVQAFRNLSERTGVDELRSLVGVLIQTDRFGTSIADALRTFADTLRTRRRQNAEERGARLPVKMIIPMVLFIFPGVGVVILGPAVISILSGLLPALAGD